MAYNKWIPFKINNRKFVTLTFASEEKEREISEFVCDGERESFIDLLLFPGTLQATSDMMRKKDSMVSLQEITVDESNPNSIKLVFTPIPQTSKPQTYTVASDEDKAKLLERLQMFNETWEQGCISCGPEEDGDKAEETVTIIESKKQKKEKITVAKQLRLRHVNTREYQMIVVNMEIKEEDRTYSTTLVFHLIPQKDFCMLALDFGSEASQMSIRNKGEFAITAISLLEKAKSKLPEFVDLKNNELKDFHQYTIDGEGKLFQSFFYAKKENERMNPIFLSKTADDDKYKNKEEYALLPSLKISLLNDSENRELLNCYRKIISKFLQTAIAQIETDNKGLAEHVGVQLYLLVPNVMEMKTIKHFIKNILGGFEELQNKNEKYRKIHLEITTRSESDASFAGYISRHHRTLHQGKNYLVIDGGKGTMDFSIIRLDNSGEYKSLYRNGFIGSGNAITYAIFDHLCAIILGTSDTQKRKSLMQSILFRNQNDQAGLKKLLLVIEKIKKNYEQSTEKIEKNCNALHNEYVGRDLSELTAAGLAERLEGLIGSFGDKYGIIHATCSNICASLFYNLEKNNISSTEYKKLSKNDAQICFDEVILAGRAFMFKMLRDELKRYLHENCLLDNHNIKFDQQDLKTACLEGALLWSFINCNSGLSGIPCKSKVFATKETPQKKYSKNGNSVGRMLFGSEGATNGGKERHDVPFSNFEINETFLMNGMDVKLDENEYLTMNGKQLDDMMNSGDYNLYFTEDGLRLRSQGRVRLLDSGNRSRQDANIEAFMIYASRFPIYDEKKDKDKLVLWKLPEL